MIENEKVVTCIYKMYVTDENGKELLIEEATGERPLIYCHGEKMMLPKFEANMAGLNKGDKFDFVIACADAYGEYDERGVVKLDKKVFYNGDGEFDTEHVFIGNIIPMRTADGQIVNAQVTEIGDKEVTIDLNHPYAGEDLHFVGEVIDLRDADPKELEAIRHPHKCGGCHGNCGDCESDCGKGESECGSDCGNHCGNDCKTNC